MMFNLAFALRTIASISDVAMLDDTLYFSHTSTEYGRGEYAITCTMTGKVMLASCEDNDKCNVGTMNDDVSLIAQNIESLLPR